MAQFPGFWSVNTSATSAEIGGDHADPDEVFPDQNAGN